MGGSVVEFSPATREARVRFPAHAARRPLLAARARLPRARAQATGPEPEPAVLTPGALPSCPAPLPPADLSVLVSRPWPPALAATLHPAARPLPPDVAQVPCPAPRCPCPFSLHDPDPDGASLTHVTSSNASKHRPRPPGHSPPACFSHSLPQWLILPTLPKPSSLCTSTDHQPSCHPSSGGALSHSLERAREPRFTARHPPVGSPGMLSMATWPRSPSNTGHSPLLKSPRAPGPCSLASTGASTPSLEGQRHRHGCHQHVGSTNGGAPAWASRPRARRSPPPLARPPRPPQHLVHHQPPGPPSPHQHQHQHQHQDYHHHARSSCTSSSSSSSSSSGTCPPPAGQRRHDRQQTEVLRGHRHHRGHHQHTGTGSMAHGPEVLHPPSPPPHQHRVATKPQDHQHTTTAIAAAAGPRPAHGQGHRRRRHRRPSRTPDPHRSPSPPLHRGPGGRRHQQRQSSPPPSPAAAEAAAAAAATRVPAPLAPPPPPAPLARTTPPLSPASPCPPFPVLICR